MSYSKNVGAWMTKHAKRFGERPPSDWVECGEAIANDRAIENVASYLYGEALSEGDATYPLEHYYDAAEMIVRGL